MPVRADRGPPSEMSTSGVMRTAPGQLPADHSPGVTVSETSAKRHLAAVTAPASTTANFNAYAGGRSARRCHARRGDQQPTDQRPADSATLAPAAHIPMARARASLSW